MSWKLITDSAARSAADWEYGELDELPTPDMFLGWTRREYWAWYRQAKARRWYHLYGRYKKPYVTEAAFGYLVDKIEKQRILAQITMLPTTRPPSEPALRKRKRAAEGAAQVCDQHLPESPELSAYLV